MADQRLKIPRATDKALVKCFKKLGSITGFSQAHITGFGFLNFGQVNLEEDLPEELDSLLKKNSALIDTINLAWPALQIRFFRGGNVQPQDKSPIYDEICLYDTNKGPVRDSNVVIDIIATISKDLKAFDPERSTSKPTEAQAHYDALHESNLQRLEGLNEELVRSTHDYRIQLDAEAKDKLDGLEQDFKAKAETLSEEFQGKEQALTKREEALEARRKELDDSSNTHARREIRRDILKEIKSRQEKFTLTDGTNNLRRPIAAAMITMIGLFLGLGTGAAFELYSALKGTNVTEILIAGAKQTLYTAGAVGSLIFYIRWMNRWFELHSQSEFSLKQFELDMERASWLVETSLEWKDAKGTSIPPELLERLSNNLFSGDKPTSEVVEHPADQLASALVGSSSKIRLATGDSYIEVDPKKLSKQTPTQQ